MNRFSLRRQDKIENSFGEPFLKCLIDSLTEYFKTHSEIEEFEYPNEKYKIILVNNVQPHTDSTFEFYVISKTFNVFNLAYKSCMS
jgi:hypothetical protein